MSAQTWFLLFFTCFLAVRIPAGLPIVSSENPNSSHYHDKYRRRPRGRSFTQKYKIVNVKSVSILCSLHVWSPSLAGQIFGLDSQSVWWSCISPPPGAAQLSLLCRTGPSTANSFRWREDEVKVGGTGWRWWLVLEVNVNFKVLSLVRPSTVISTRSSCVYLATLPDSRHKAHRNISLVCS